MPRIPGHVFFSAEDDHNLAQYIAKHRPEPKGRLGNNLYIQLEENAGNQWPWSCRHPWTSWRERYKKNQDSMDYLISKYQKKQLKKKKPTSEAEKEEEGVEEKGSTSNIGPAVENQPEAERVSSKANVNDRSEKKKPKTAAKIPDSRPHEAADIREGDGKKETVPSKPSSDARPQKVAETLETLAREQNTVMSEPLHQQKPQKAAWNGANEAKVAASKLAPTPNRQQIKEMRDNVSRERSDASKPVLDIRPPTLAVQQEEQEPADTQDISIQSLSENEMRELFGSFVEEEEEEQDQEQEPEQNKHHATSNVTEVDKPRVNGIEVLDSQSGPNIYPNLQNVPTPELSTSEPRVPGHFEVQPAAQTFFEKPVHTQFGAETRSAQKSPLKPPRARPKQRKSNKDEDPFDTSSDSSLELPAPPPPHRRASATKKPPVFEDSHFRTTFKRSHAVAADNEEDEDEDRRPWPPKRSKKERDAVRQSNVPAPFAHPRQPPPQVNAVASSSKTKLTSLILIPVDDPAGAIPRTHSEPLLGHDVPSRSPVIERRTFNDVTKPRRSANTNPRTQVRTSAPILTTSININNEVAPTSNARSPTEHQNMPLKPTSDTDPFTAKHYHPVSEKAAGKARVDDSYVIEKNDENEKPTRRIDLHQETLSKRRRLTNTSRLPRRSSMLSSPRSSFSPLIPKKDRPRRSNSLRQSISELELPDDDTKDLLIAAAESIAGSLEKLAEEYGFEIEHVENTFKKTRSIEKTKTALYQLRQDLDQLERETMKKKQALYARLNFVSNVDGDENDSDTEIPHGLVIRKSNGGRSSTRSSPRKSKGKRPSLTIRPLIIDDDDDDVVSDYSPPNSSRAGQFARLVRQGRREEAIEREKRRASGVFVPQTQHGGGIDRSLLRREITATPTPHSRDAVPMDMDTDIDDDHKTADIKDEDDNDDDDDIYVHTDDEQQPGSDKVASEKSHEADDEFEQTQEQQKEDRSYDSDHNSQSLTEAPRKQKLEEAREQNNLLIQKACDQHPQLALEFQSLAMTVNADNGEKMREFAARNDPDFLRLMSLKLVGDFVSKFEQD